MSTSNDDPSLGEAAGAPVKQSIPLGRLVMLAVKLTGAFVVVAVGGPWLVVMTPRWLVRGASLGFLWSMLVLVVMAVPAVITGGVWAALAALYARRRHDAAALVRAVRMLSLAVSCGLGLIAVELICQAKQRYTQRIPALPTRFAARPSYAVPTIISIADAEKNGVRATDAGSAATEDELYLVVVGESSARGEPYHPWLSVGQLIGWQLERVFPGRKVRVDVRANGGLCLEQAILLLADLEQRPDAIIVFAGHNEFQARYGWSRNVRHYVEEGPESPLALLEMARRATGTTRTILATIDLYYAEAAPPPRVTRELVDHPTCTPTEYAMLRDEFHFRLEKLVEYCNRIGSLPVLIMPGSNDGAFDPSRSVLAGSTPAGARAQFDREFQAARALEPDDAEAAVAAYRRLVEQHPEFAETHYRLGRLLAAAGAWDEARRHFVAARDLDGLPLRCPTDFARAYRQVAEQYHALLVDGPAVLGQISPHGVLDDHVYHDAQHPNLTGIIALANDALRQLAERRAFGWDASTPTPSIELEECVRHFELNAEKWTEVCKRSKSFYDRTAYTRFDPAERLEVANQYGEAATAISAGRMPQGPLPPSVAIALRVLPQPEPTSKQKDHKGD